MSTGTGLAGDGSKNPGGDHRFQILLALIGVAGAIIAAVIGLKPWSHSSPPSTSRCVFLTPNNVACTSSNPEVTIEFNNEVSSVGCMLRTQVNWGDRSPKQTFNFEGGPVGPFVLGNHKYGHTGVYSITATSVVLNQCAPKFSTFPGSYSFTLG
jgi:hypothetical protein